MILSLHNLLSKFGVTGAHAIAVLLRIAVAADRSLAAFARLKKRRVRQLAVFCSVVDVDAGVASVELRADEISCVDVSASASEIFDVVDSVRPAVAAIRSVPVLILLQLRFQACVGRILVVTTKTFEIRDHGGDGSEAVGDISPESSDFEVAVDPVAGDIALDAVLEALFERGAGDGDKCVNDFLKF